MSRPADPIARRRAQISRWSQVAKRVGYGAVLGAVVVFVIGAATALNTAVTAIVVGCLAVSALTLIPAFIFGYGVRAAERDELGLPPGH